MTLTQHIDAIIAKVNDHTLSKVDISSIVDDLTTVTSDVPLSANQGKVLKDLIDGINAILQSDDGTLDELQEVVNYIKANRSTLEALTLDNIAETADKKHFTLDEKNKLAAIEEGATADMTGAEIKALYEGEADTNVYTDAEKTLVGVGTTLDTTSPTLPGAVNEVHGEVAAHTADTVDAHAASAIGYVAGTNTYAIGTELQTVVEQIDTELENQDGRLDTLEADDATAGSVLKTVKDTAENATFTPDTNVYATSTNINAAIDELDAEAVAQGGRLNILEADVDTVGSVLNTIRETGADATYDGTTSGLTATTLESAIGELDDMVDINAANVAVIIDAMSGLSDASGSVSSSVEVNIPTDGSLLAVSGYTVKTQSTDTDVFELDGATGKVTVKTPGKYSFVMTFYAKALDKDPTITPRIVINSNAGIVYDDTLGLIKVKKDGIIFPTNVLIEVTEAMLAGGDLELDMEIGHVETVNADRQVAVTGFDAVISTMGGVYSGFADHGQLTGTTDTNSHPASAISVVPQGNLSSDSVQLALEELDNDITSLTTVVEW
jgi:hypothetical protein